MVKIKTMILVSLLINTLMGFGCLGAGLSGIGMPLVPFIVVAILFINAILFFVCAFGCDWPSFGGKEQYENYYEKNIHNDLDYHQDEKV